LIEFPELPKGVHSPNIQKNMMFALIAGFFAGIALALVLEFFDRSIKSPDDVERFLQIPFLGIVPKYVSGNGNGNGNGSRMLAKKTPAELELAFRSQDLLIANDPMSHASEAIRTVRTSLLLSFPEAPPRSILITSSRAGEGKTFISSNLAIALTQLDKRAVLIDADMRNPRVHRVWDDPNEIGLSNYLTSDLPLSAVLRKAPVNGLSYITSGARTPRPAELLASGRFHTLLKNLEEQFDFVILDSPPVLPVADSVILASKAQCVLIVVYGGATPRDVVKMAKKKLGASNPIIVGTVVNGIDFNDPYYYYRYYSNYSYKYYGRAESPDNSSKVL
jgi:capsular exopolysaccharide synthesis family protein